MDILIKTDNRAEENEQEEEEGKFPGYNIYKRWEWFNQSRVYPSGEFPLVESVLHEYKIYLRNKERLKRNASNRMIPATWQNLNSPTAPTGYMSAGVGRVNCLTFMPGNNNILFAGSACGGVWKSFDGGVSWTVLNTDQLPSLSITSIVIDPDNTDNIYIATGDNFTGFPISGVLKQGHFSAGIYKSNNAGLTWSLAGFPHTQSDGFIPQQLIIDHATPAIMLLASNTGIWRSIDHGTNWTHVNSSGFFYSIEFNPLNSNVVYATNGLGLWRSNNNGVGWTYKGGGYPNTPGGRVSLAVTPADTNYIYVWGPVNGLKKSVDGGNTLNTVTNPDNIAQPYGYVDRSIGVSNTNAMHVMVGGLLTAKSADGGVTWLPATDWQNIEAPNWVHADAKKIVYEPGSGNKLYITNDGGVAVSNDNAATWTDISNGLQIAEIYKIANHPHHADTIYFGAQDMGTYRWLASDSSFNVLAGGDGFQPLVDPTNTNTLFASLQIGQLRKSIDNGESFFSASPGQYLWDPPIKMNPLNHNTMYVGCTAGVKKSTEGGIQGTYVNLSGSVLANIIAMDITKADTNYIYAASINQMIRSEDGGSNWTNITAGLPVSDAAITYICASTTDPKKVFVSFSGYSPGNK
ncbi:MAG TPA: sialidase family protein, partial [Saprospiraceae bacterium]|nr:sialidase family protein [Saprospiraceae bacterium]